MRTLRFGLLMVSALLAGCVNTSQPERQFAQPVSQPPRFDEVFPTYTQHRLESEQEIFALDADARAFVRTAVGASDDPYKQMQALVSAIFDRSAFNLLYAGDANTTATQTFHNRAANCLSMSIMTYAMAREAGFGVRFRDVDIPEYWVRRQGRNMLSDHVNLVLIPPNDPDTVRLLATGLLVDFDPDASRSHLPYSVIPKDAVLAMFYNNKGADALLNGDVVKAYAYFREATVREPLFDAAWVNLGLLYRQQGYPEYAEHSYLHALASNPNNLAAMENMALLYRQTGRNSEAAVLTARVAAERYKNPYYHFILGEVAYEQHQYDEALRHYRRAQSMGDERPEVFFGLARTHYALGDVAKSRRMLELASREARSVEEQGRYQQKLHLIASQERQ